MRIGRGLWSTTSLLLQPRRVFSCGLVAGFGQLLHCLGSIYSARRCGLVAGFGQLLLAGCGCPPALRCGLVAGFGQLLPGTPDGTCRQGLRIGRGLWSTTSDILRELRQYMLRIGRGLWSTTSPHRRKAFPLLTLRATGFRKTQADEEQFPVSFAVFPRKPSSVRTACP